MTEPNLDLNALTKSIRSFEKPRLNTKKIFSYKEMKQLAESMMHISNAIEQWHVEMKRLLSTK